MATSFRSVVFSSTSLGRTLVFFFCRAPEHALIPTARMTLAASQRREQQKCKLIWTDVCASSTLTSCRLLGRLSRTLPQEPSPPTCRVPCCLLDCSCRGQPRHDSPQCFDVCSSRHLTLERLAIDKELVTGVPLQRCTPGWARPCSVALVFSGWG